MSHAPYIAEVRRHLETRDIRTTLSDSPAPAAGCRAAALLLRPAQDAFPARVSEEALLSWDEENGWSLAARDPDTGTGVPVREGTSVLPGPGNVAAWAVVLLTRPDKVASRDRPAPVPLSVQSRAQDAHHAACAQRPTRGGASTTRAAIRHGVEEAGAYADHLRACLEAHIDGASVPAAPMLKVMAQAGELQAVIVGVFRPGQVVARENEAL